MNQIVFDDFALEFMGFAHRREGSIERKYSVKETSIEVFLDSNASREEKISNWKRSRLKGSEKFQKILENYVNIRKQNYKIPPAGLSF